MNEIIYSEPLTDRELDILRLKVKRHTNQEIGNMLHLARNTVRWYVSQIYSKLHVTNRRELKTYAEEHGLLEETPIPQPASKDNLPNPITSFVGRKREISDIRQLLSSTRLLTLSGTGGTGKTRLALKATENLANAFPDGIYFVNLAPLTDPDRVAKAIADALKLRESGDEMIEDTLKRVLKSKNSLLILDNFEHVIAAAPLVSDLIKHTNNLHILVTSREVLQLYGEHEYMVPPLPLIDIARTKSLQELADNDAVQLFVQRAGAVSRQFQLTENNAEAVSEICTRLDGLPLAIELAAAQIKMLNPQAILKRMENHLDTFKGRTLDLPQRHQTIRDTIAWSYDLLDESEKKLFARLSVFRGGRSLDAVEAVCQDGLPIDVFDGLASLVNKNLIRQYEDSLGEPRFWMLETIHTFALECLEADGELEIYRRRHAEYFFQVAGQAEIELKKANQKTWFKRLEIELDNIRTILQWTLNSADPELGIKILFAMTDFWAFSTYQFEGDRWSQYALEYVDDITPTSRSRLYGLVSMMSYRSRSNYLQAHGFATLALEVARQLKDKRTLAIALRIMAQCYIMREGMEDELPLEEGLSFVEQSITLWRELGDLGELALTLSNKAQILSDYDLANAVATNEECIGIARLAGDPRRIYVSLGNLASCARYMGDHDRAKSLMREALQLAREADDRYLMASTLRIAYNPSHEPERTTRVLGALDAALNDVGTILNPSAVAHFQKNMTLARENLSQEDFEKAWTEGSAMTLDEAVAYVLEEE